MDEQEKTRRTAIHESGHAVWACVMGRPLAYVTVIPNAGTLGRTVFAGRMLINMTDHRQIEREAALHLAGFLAELIHDRRNPPTGCDGEVWYAYRLLTAVGHSDAGFYKVTWRATKALIAVWPCVLTLAAELHRRGTLDGLAVRRLVQRELGLRRRWNRRSRLSPEATAIPRRRAALALSMRRSPKPPGWPRS